MRRIARVNRPAAPVLRYIDASADVLTILDKVREEHFPELVNAKFATFFDLKKRKSNGKIVLARIQKSNDLIKKLTVEERRNTEGVDYVLAIDQVAWVSVADIDKERILRHELRHCVVDQEAKKPYKLTGHDLEDFTAEVVLNTADPGWASRVATLVTDIYDQEAEIDQDNG